MQIYRIIKYINNIICNFAIKLLIYNKKLELINVNKYIRCLYQTIQTQT
jgi:hypothetical protein